MKEIFCDNLNLFLKSIVWLEKSFIRCKSIDFDNLSEEDIEKLETFAARFGSSVDILINKLLRSLDIVELEDVSRKLDVVIRAEKRGFVENYEELIELKNLRNELSHEYIEEVFVEKIMMNKDQSLKLFAIKDKIVLYAQKFKLCEDV